MNPQDDAEVRAAKISKAFAGKGHIIGLRMLIAAEIRSANQEAYDQGRYDARLDGYLDAAKIMQFQIGSSLETALDRELVRGGIYAIRAKAEELG